MTDAGGIEAAIAVAEVVRSLPYQWPSPPDAESARALGVGSCASKHALLAEELSALSLLSTPLLVTGPLLPAALHDEPEFAPARELLEVHELIVVHTPWSGPVRVDITWDPPLVEHGLPGEKWLGTNDTPIAVAADGPGWSVPRENLRPMKEALRSRLYAAGERPIRDKALAAMNGRFAEWRSLQTDPAASANG